MSQSCFVGFPRREQLEAHHSCQLSVEPDLTTMTASAEAERQGRSEYSECRETRRTSSITSIRTRTSVNSQSTKTFASKLRRSLQYGTFKQVNHLIIKIIAIVIIIMVRRRQGPVRGL